MTDWIKDNKLAASLLLVAILGALGTFFFAGAKTEAYEAAKSEFDTSASKLNRLQGRKPFPDAGNLKERRQSVTEFRGKVEDLQKALLQYRPKEFAKITPAAFTTRLTQVGDGLKASYDDKGIEYPDAWQMGFEAYTTGGGTPKDGATAYLNYQLSGLEWLYAELAKTGVSGLLNVHRPTLPVEQGKPMTPKPGKGNRAGAATPYHALPLELTFRGREASLRKLLSSLADSKKYFFLVRSMRVQNVKFDKPPRLTDVEFEKPKDAGGDDDLFGGLFDDIPDDEATPDDGGSADEGIPAEGDDAAPAPAPAPDQPGTERTLGQVLGDEELHVFLQLELILFRGDVKLPEVK